MSLSGTETGRERASGDAEWHHWPGMPAAWEQPRRTAPRRAAFWLVAGVFCLLFFAAGAPIAAVRRLPGSAAVLGDDTDRDLCHLRLRASPHAAGLRVGVGLPGPPPRDPGRPRRERGRVCGVPAAHSAGLLFAARALQGAAVGTAIGAVGAAPPRSAGAFAWGPCVPAASPAQAAGPQHHRGDAGIRGDCIRPGPGDATLPWRRTLPALPELGPPR